MKGRDSGLKCFAGSRGGIQCCFAHLKFRRVAVRPKPQDEQYPFRLWYECRPHRRQRMCTVRFPIFPSDAVPFVIPPPHGEM